MLDESSHTINVQLLVQVRLGLGALSHLIGVGDEAQSERDKLA